MKLEELSDDNFWLLRKIAQREKSNEERRQHGTQPIRIDHKWIWQGCYDVWFTEQDQIDAIEIPRRRMKEAEEAGLIVSSEDIWSRGEKTFRTTVWTMTELGRDLLKQKML